MRALIAALGVWILLSGCVSTGAVRDARADEVDVRTLLRKADQALRDARLTDAEVLYRELTETHPEMPEVWLRLGNVYTRKAQLEAAIRAYRDGLRYDRSDGRLWYNLAIAQLKQAANTLEASSAVLPVDSPYRPQIQALHQSLLRGASPAAGEGDI